MLRSLALWTWLALVVALTITVAETSGLAVAEPIAPVSSVFAPVASDDRGAVPSAVAANPAGTPAHDPSAAAVEERRRSATRFAGLAPAAAVSADRSAFPELVGAQSWKPLNLANGDRVAAYRDDDHIAEVVDAAGRRSVLTSTAPMRNNGAAVDLGLRPVYGGYAPVNAPTDVRLSATAAGGVGVGRIDLTVAGAAAAPGMTVGDTLVWPSALTDTDVVGQAVPNGVELSAVLRSAASPTEVDLVVSMPIGASLREDAQTGGVAVVDASGQPMTHISAPVAWDADHVPVRATMVIVGTHVRLHVDVAGRDIAWPVVVDPTVWDTRSGCSLASAPWQWFGATGYGVSSFYGDAGWGCGMYQRLPNPTYVNFPDGVFSWWELSLYGRPGAHIQWVQASNMNHDTGANAIGTAPTCTYLNVWYDDTHTEYPWNARCDSYRNVTQTIGTQNAENGYHGDKALVGLHTAGAGTRGYFQQSVGALQTELSDYIVPSGTITGPSGWQPTRAVSFNVTGSDNGLGVRSIDVGASGYVRTLKGNCPWSIAICDPSVSGAVNFDNLSEGRSNARAIVTDAAGNSPEITPTEFKVDVTGPVLALSGPLYDAREDFVSGSLSLTVNATDGSTSSASAERSGVKRIEVYVNDFLVQSTGDLACSAGSCARSATYTFDPAAWPGGDQEVRVRAYDWLNHFSDQSITVYTDETHNAPDLESPPDSSIATLAAPVTLAVTNAHTILWGLSDQKAAPLKDSRMLSLGLTTYRLIAEYDTVRQALGGACEAPGADPSTYAACYLDATAPGLPACSSGMTTSECRSFRAKSPANALRRVDRWMRSACPNRACGSKSILVSFNPDAGTIDKGHEAEAVNPTVDQYAPAVKAFRARYPYVKLYTAWNEPNCCSGMINDPARAAALYLELRSQCTQPPTCTVAAGEFVDNALSAIKHRYPIVNGTDTPGAPLQTYLTAYRTRLGSVVPDAWAIHAYTTGNAQKRTDMDYFVQQTQTDPTDPINSDGPSIWLTEQGGLYRLGNQTFPTAPSPPPADRAQKAVRYLVGNSATGAEGIVNHYARVTRFYLYHWRGGLDWDSGLTARSGATGSPPITPVRPEFYCYRFVTNPQSGDADKCNP